MSLLDIKNFTRTPIDKIKKMSDGDRIELLTYKKDRKVVLVKKDAHLYDVLQDGFETKEFHDVEEPKLEKLLKQLQRIEFPRSNKYFLEIYPVSKKKTVK